jgi:hypothetical protein
MSLNFHSFLKNHLILKNPNFHLFLKNPMILNFR